MKLLFKNSGITMLIAAAIGLTASIPQANAKPNVLIFMADDLGQDATRLYNGDDSALVQMRGAPPFNNPFPRNAPMPTLEALAQQGATFKNAWAHPVCSVTRAARSTGKYASTTGVGQVVGRFTPRFGAPGTRFAGVEFPPTMLHPDDPNMLQRLVRSAGYRTWKFGKWHEVEVDFTGKDFDPLDLTDPVAAALATQGLNDVHRSGFDEFYGLLSGFFGGINGNGYGGGEVMFADQPTGAKLDDTMTDAIHMIDTQSTRVTGPGNVPDARNPTTEFADSAMVSRAIELIEGAAGNPWFVEYSALAPHFQYEVPPGPWTAQPADFAGEAGGWRTLNLADHGEVIAQIIIAFNDLDDTTVPTAAMVIDNPGLYPNLYPLAGTRALVGNGGPAEAQRRAAFKGLVSYMDVQMGRLLEHIDWSNTYVIFIGDNGTQGGGVAFNVIEPPNERFKSKATVYRNGREMPLVFVGPGKVKNALLTKDLVNVTDLYATVLELIGVKQPGDTKKSSYSFAGALEGRKSKRKVNVSEQFPATASVGGTNPFPQPGGPFGPDQRAVGDAQHSLIAFSLMVDGEFVCREDSAALPENECLNPVTGDYEKETTLEFHDSVADPYDKNPLFLEEMTGVQNAAFSQLCTAHNQISREATYYLNGKDVCNPNGDQLRKDPPARGPDTDEDGSPLL